VLFSQSQEVFLESAGGVNKFTSLFTFTKRSWILFLVSVVTEKVCLVNYCNEEIFRRLKKFKMEKSQVVCLIEKSLSFSAFDTKWVPCSAKIVVLGSYPRSTGAIHIYELDGSELSLVKEVKC